MMMKNNIFEIILRTQKLFIAWINDIDNINCNKSIDISIDAAYHVGENYEN